MKLILICQKISFFRRIKLMFTEKGWDQNPQFEGRCMDMELFGFQNIKGNSKEN